MGRYKRKASSNQDEEDQLANDSSDYRESKAKPKRRSIREKAVKAESNSEDELGSDNEEPPAKKAKKAPAQVKQEDVSGSGSIAIHSTADGDRYIDLGKKKRATVRSFKGTALLDIREFYGADGDEKPGKKGIALTLEQWETLKSSSTVIDSLFQSLKK